MLGIISRRGASFGIAVAGLATLAACSVAPDYTAPAFPFLSRYQAAPGAPVLLGNSAWWQKLDDPVLDRLVSLALRDGISLTRARDRVSEAQAARQAVPGAATLAVSAAGRAEKADGGDMDITAPLRLGLDWMLDPWGGRKTRLRAEDARIDAAQAELDAARLLMIYNMTNAYLDLRYSQALQGLARSEQKERRRTLALTRQLRNAGEATRLDITRSEARIAEIAAELPVLGAGVSAAQNQIAVLAGVAPGTLPADLATALARSSALPRPDMTPQVGIPTDLLRNRPDIRIAERGYAAAVAEIGVARAAAYPTLSLAGAIALDALSGGTDYFFGPSLQLPALNPAVAKATISRREAAARAAFQDWRAAVLGAILEVENALVNYDALTSADTAAANAVRLYGRARDLTRRVFERNEATFSDLIDAEQSLAASRRQLARLHRDRARAFVDLNIRIGAGHGVDSQTPPAPVMAKSAAPKG